MAVAVVEQKIVITKRLGLHARPAAEFVKLAGKFQSDVSLRKDDAWVNGKSIMGVMTLAAEFGSALTIRAEGDDAQAAVKALATSLTRTVEEE